MMKNCHHQHKGKPRTQEKSQVAATSSEDGRNYRYSSYQRNWDLMFMYSNWRTRWIPWLGGSRISSGGKGIVQSTSKRVITCSHSRPFFRAKMSHLILRALYGLSCYFRAWNMVMKSTNFCAATAQWKLYQTNFICLVPMEAGHIFAIKN
jgi:hypothetical protein